jgi:RNA polymerase sigma factor (TIGR02999 family)
MNDSSARPPAPAEITRLLLSFRLGEPDAGEKLFPLIYDELRAMARRRLGSRSPGQTLDTVGLVHEAYIRLFDQTRLEWQDRKHFYSVIAMAMRQIVVDHARRRLAKKRGGGQMPMDIDIADPATDERAEEVLAVHEALDDLKALDERLARLVELRFFAGFSVEEIAEMLEVSPRTVKRDWRKARALLYEALRQSPEP